MRVYLIGLIFVLAVASVRGAVMQSFSRYALILDRRPFGEAPAEAETVSTKPVVRSGPSFVDSLRMCAITAVGESLRVGFVDTKQKKTYFLFVGDSEDGIEVVSADYDAETALLRKGGEERELSMVVGGGGSGAVQRSTTPGNLRNASGFKVSKGRVLSPGRQRRIEERKRRAAMLPALHGQVLEKHLQEYNMAIIREGVAPPLPIPLTQDQDDALVAEGVLPPRE